MEIFHQKIGGIPSWNMQEETLDLWILGVIQVLYLNDS